MKPTVNVEPASAPVVAERPVPPSSALSAPYWEGVAAGRLMLQRCGACGVLRHYPRLLCSACHSKVSTWQEASRRGTIYSWTVAHYAYHPSFVGDLPYTLVTVNLEEGPRALGRWRGPAPSIGLAVAGDFEARPGGFDLVFVPAN